LNGGGINLNKLSLYENKGNKMKYAQLIKTSLFALGMTSATVMAATQGTLGPTSTGTINLTLDIDPLVMVSNLGDINLGTFSGAGNLTGNDAFCVYRNGAGNYNITMNGNGTASAYTLASGGNTLAYTVDFNNGGLNAMTATTPLAAQTGADTVDTDCLTNGDNVSVGITVSNAALAAAPAGTYIGVLTMVVAPE
jgi:hypothetical protein